MLRLGRQRSPVPCELPFTYWVFGRPVSTRNDDGSKPRALPTWREKVNEALAQAVEAATKNRGFVPTAGTVALHVTWLSLDPSDRSQPDIDNMLKPLIDALNTTVIEDDRQVHRILAEKGSINAPPAFLASVFSLVQEDPAFGLTAEVTIITVDALSKEKRA